MSQEKDTLIPYFDTLNEWIFLNAKFHSKKLNQNSKENLELALKKRRELKNAEQLLPKEKQKLKPYFFTAALATLCEEYSKDLYHSFTEIVANKEVYLSIPTAEIEQMDLLNYSLACMRCTGIQLTIYENNPTKRLTKREYIQKVTTKAQELLKQNSSTLNLPDKYLKENKEEVYYESNC